jgi:hypothetical protein
MPPQKKENQKKAAREAIEKLDPQMIMAVLGRREANRKEIDEVKAALKKASPEAVQAALEELSQDIAEQEFKDTAARLDKFDTKDLRAAVLEKYPEIEAICRFPIGCLYHIDICRTDINPECVRQIDCTRLIAKPCEIACLTFRVTPECKSCVNMIRCYIYDIGFPCKSNCIISNIGCGLCVGGDICGGSCGLRAVNCSGCINLICGSGIGPICHGDIDPIELVCKNDLDFKRICLEQGYIVTGLELKGIVERAVGKAIIEAKKLGEY